MVSTFLDACIVLIPSIAIPLLVLDCWVKFRRDRVASVIAPPEPLAVEPTTPLNPLPVLEPKGLVGELTDWLPPVSKVSRKALREWCVKNQIPGWGAHKNRKADLYDFVAQRWGGAIA